MKTDPQIMLGGKESRQGPQPKQPKTSKTLAADAMPEACGVACIGDPLEVGREHTNTKTQKVTMQSHPLDRTLKGTHDQRDSNWSSCSSATVP